MPTWGELQRRQAEEARLRRWLIELAVIALLMIVCVSVLAGLYTYEP